jgi:hypothetical protein
MAELVGGTRATGELSFRGGESREESSDDGIEIPRVPTPEIPIDPVLQDMDHFGDVESGDEEQAMV